MKTPDISKLPKWAQERINDLGRQRDEAVKRLEQFEENQKEGNVEVYDIVCSHSPPHLSFIRFNSRRIQFSGHGLTVEVCEPIHRAGIQVQWSHSLGLLSHRIPIELDGVGKIFIPELKTT